MEQAYHEGDRVLWKEVGIPGTVVGEPSTSCYYLVHLDILYKGGIGTVRLLGYEMVPLTQGRTESTQANAPKQTTTVYRFPGQNDDGTIGDTGRFL